MRVITIAASDAGRSFLRSIGMEKRVFWKRMTGIFVGIVFILSLIVMLSSVNKADAAGADDAYATKKIYEWHLAGYNDDIPALNNEAYCLLCWARNGVAYCAGDSISSDNEIIGRRMADDPYLDSCLKTYNSEPYNQWWLDSFRTTSTKGAWKIKTVGSEEETYSKETYSMPIVELRTSKGALLHGEWSGWISSGIRLSNSVPEDSWKYRFVTVTGDAAPGTGDLCDGDAIKFYLNTASPRLDVFLDVKSSTVGSDCRENAWDYGDQDNLFRLYVCNEIYVPAIMDRYVVESGNTFQLKTDAYLDDGVELVIEPGAVVTLDEGVFYNNGKILNYGTLILRDGATMSYYDPQTRSGSTIINYGSDTTYTNKAGVKMKGEGNLIVMPGAKLLLQNADNSGGSYTGPVLQFTEGSTFVNYGLAVSPFSTVFSGCHVQLKEGSAFVSGKNFTKKLGVFETMKISDMNDFGPVKVPTPGCSFQAPKNYVDSYGTWYNVKQEIFNSANAEVKTDDKNHFSN